jgi:Flp pilus assembly pilin Flp
MRAPPGQASSPVVVGISLRMRCRHGARTLVVRRKETDMTRTRRRKGQGMTEYIIIVGLIAILLVGAVTLFKNQLEKTFNSATNNIDRNITDKIK